MIIPDTHLRDKVREHPKPLLFATISGAHLYGFPSADSDYDMRGAHILALSEVVGLDQAMETIELTNKSTVENDGIEWDIVSHDIRKFFTLLLKTNGYVLEQLYSPLVVYSTPGYEELKTVARGCITKHHVYHYLGFAETQWKLFNKENPRRIKPLLYVYRVLLTGIHLMQTGEIDANLISLNEKFRFSYLSDLIDQKCNGTEHAVLPGSNIELHQQEYGRLVRELNEAHAGSNLPEFPSARNALNDLLIRLRLSPPNLPAFLQ